MSVSSDWKSTLISIIEELDDFEFLKMLEYLERIPKYQRNTRLRVQMAQIIIEHYGEEESISEVSRVMDLIPRRDSPVQNLLCPFVDKLKTRLRKEETGLERRRRNNGNNQEKSVRGEILEMSEDRWREAMTNIFRNLEAAQYKKILEGLEKFGFTHPKRITAKFKSELPQRIMEMFGFEGSISFINKAMAEIQRNDPAVQNLLRPFLEILEMSEDRWREAMTNIFRNLEAAQYKKMLEGLEKFGFTGPKRITAKFKSELPQRIMEMFGFEGSISFINKAMAEIQRNDPAVQNLLRPFLACVGMETACLSRDFKTALNLKN